MLTGAASVRVTVIALASTTTAPGAAETPLTVTVKSKAAGVVPERVSP